MKLGVYSRMLKHSTVSLVQNFLQILSDHGIEFTLYHDLFEALKGEVDLSNVGYFDKSDNPEQHGIDFMVSLGGDGTFLDTLTIIKNSDVPVMGVNTGRLGFLSNISKEKAETAVKDLINGHFSIEERTLIKLESNKTIFEEGDLALNDFTIHKRDNSSMVTINTFLNGELFNTYWADGLIVSTPTGSTGYSLSCGGPVIFPDSQNFVVTPVAPHNLNIRPIVVSDGSVISFEVKGRGSNFLVSLDSRYEVLDYSYQLAVHKAQFKLKLVKLNRQNFIQTLREKLMWGVDNRNL